jgi:hypothetical protein
MTPQVLKWDKQRKAGMLDRSVLPAEKLYPMTDPAIRRRLAMDAHS